MDSSRPNRPTQKRLKKSAPKPQEVVMVLIHGFRGTKQGLQLIGKELRSAGKKEDINYNLIAPDLPGFGNGAKLATYDLESYTKWLQGYLKTVKQRFPRKKIVLLGHSFGSIICAAYAEKHPKTFDKLILINPIGSPALEGPKKAMSKLATLYYKIGTKLPANLAKSWLSSRLIVRVMSITMAKTKDKELLKYIHGQHDKYFSRFHNPKSLLEAFEVSISYNVSQFAANIPNQTLLIAGAIDDITPLSAQFGLVKKFPNAKLKVIDNVGHLTHYETPQEVAHHIQEFIKSV